MQKGLIPLAALDIIRGWTVLEITVESGVGKSLVKVTAHNKLTDDDIRRALFALYEDQGRFMRQGLPPKGRDHGKGKSPIMWAQGDHGESSGYEAYTIEEHPEEWYGVDSWDQTQNAWWTYSEDQQTCLSIRSKGLDPFTLGAEPTGNEE